ncbi:hypothetical protein HID58_008923, partial [Brassica napus]
IRHAERFGVSVKLTEEEKRNSRAEMLKAIGDVGPVVDAGEMKIANFWNVIDFLLSTEIFFISRSRIGLYISSHFSIQIFRVRWMDLDWLNSYHYIIFISPLHNLAMVESCVNWEDLGSQIENFDCSEFPTRIAGEIKSFSTEGWVAPKLSKRMDKFMLYLLTAGKKALADGGVTSDEVMAEFNKAKCGVLIGSAMGGMKVFNDAIVSAEDLLQEDESFLCTFRHNKH